MLRQLVDSWLVTGVRFVIRDTVVPLDPSQIGDLSKGVSKAILRVTVHPFYVLMAR